MVCREKCCYLVKKTRCGEGVVSSKGVRSHRPVGRRPEYERVDDWMVRKGKAIRVEEALGEDPGLYKFPGSSRGSNKTR